MEKSRGCGALLTFYVSRGQASSVHQAKAAERGDGKGTSEGHGSQTIEGLAAKSEQPREWPPTASTTTGRERKRKKKKEEKKEKRGARSKCKSFRWGLVWQCFAPATRKDCWDGLSHSLICNNCTA